MRLCSCLCLIVGSLVAAAGCGSGGGPTLHPVEGKVSVNGKPLAAASILLHPETNPSSGAWSGLASNGAYAVSAPAGRYKVTVDSNPVSDEPRPKVDAKYADVTKTPLSIEVSPSPASGAYDLVLK